jgi:hypothetical protein
MTHGQGASTDEQESRRNRDTGDNDDDDDDVFGNIEGIIWEDAAASKPAAR